VRQAWIGITLPLAPGETKARRFKAGALLPGARGWVGRLRRWLFGSITIGYLVESAVALERLAARSPDAFEWWRANTPHLLSPGLYLVFQSYACRIRLEGPPPVRVPPDVASG